VELGKSETPGEWAQAQSRIESFRKKHTHPIGPEGEQTGTT